jgi:hypothetical protein
MAALHEGAAWPNICDKLGQLLFHLFHMLCSLSSQLHIEKVTRVKLSWHSLILSGSGIILTYVCIDDMYMGVGETQ